jgi:hypothetical protein
MTLRKAVPDADPEKSLGALNDSVERIGSRPTTPAGSGTTNDVQRSASRSSHKSHASRNTQATIDHDLAPSGYQGSGVGVGGGAPGAGRIGNGTAALWRTVSPPYVSAFGGVAPDGLDAEEGLVAVRSREEEEERIAERDEKGPDPWAVKFEPGEQINPKVRSDVACCITVQGA